MKIPVLYQIERFFHRFRFRKKHVTVDHFAKLCENNTINIREQDLKNISLSINGRGNTINIKSVKFGGGARISIFVTGDNNTINIDENLFVGHNLIITIGRASGNFIPVENVSVNIGSDTGIGTATLVTYNSNTHINIGRRCMLAFDVMIYNTDAHPIYDIDSGDIINRVYGVDIGDHVWLAGHSSVLKNTIIPNGCIVGWHCVATGRYTEENCAIAGNPGRVVRKNIRWDSDGKTGYCQNVITKEQGALS
ncbi:MAG: hypothetical protein J6K82_01870 [Alphaproteobacteria bacterium]|nr:hypothetical protein [Alphaproteobacteria bacterium]